MTLYNTTRTYTYLQVLAPLTASPAAAAALGAGDRERLRTVVRQAIWCVFGVSFACVFLLRSFALMLPSNTLIQ